jgi:hypothetical protein
MIASQPLISGEATKLSLWLEGDIRVSSSTKML